MKKVMTMALATAMCMSMAVGAMASEIQPRAPRCTECGSSTYAHTEVETDTDTDWHNDHFDTIKITITKTGYMCSNCGEFDYTTKTKTVTTCPNA